VVEGHCQRLERQNHALVCNTGQARLGLLLHAACNENKEALKGKYPSPNRSLFHAACLNMTNKTLIQISMSTMMTQRLFLL
jgi:hypothetical protein